MIPKLLSRANSQEVATCVDNCLTEVENTSISENAHFKAMCTELRSRNSVLDASMGTIRSMELSETMETEDEYRDNLVSGIQYCLKGFMYSEDPVISKNTKLLYELIKAHGNNIGKLGYAQETATINSILLKIYSAEYLPLLETIPGLKAFFDYLKIRNENFEKLYQESLRNKAKDEPGISASEQRKLVRDYLNKDFLPFVEVMSKAIPTEFAQLSRVITEAIERINTNVRARITRQKTEEESLKN